MDNKTKAKELVCMAFLAVIIAISGTFKIPGIIPGTEFQLSAPIAIAIAGCFGFRKYICSGIVASIINVLLGTHTLLNVMVAMVFRVVAGSIISVFGNHLLVLSIAGPIGTFVGRIVLSFVIGTSFKPLLVVAFPGMIYTLLTSYIFYTFMVKVIQHTTFREVLSKTVGVTR